MMNRPILILSGIAALVVLGMIGIVFVLPSTNNANTPVALVATKAVDTPTPVPTFTPSTTPTTKPADTATPQSMLTPTPTDTAAPSNTPAPPTATNTAPPPAATATRRPPTATPVPPPPTNTPKPSVDFKVVKARMLSITENSGCNGNHNFFITVIDKNGAPMNGIYVERRYLAQVQVPPTGDKGTGKTEDEAGAGNAYHVIRDTSGRQYTSEWTREMSTIDENIPNSELIAGGYCRDENDCNSRKGPAVNQLCRRHYSYEVVFQKQ